MPRSGQACRSRSPRPWEVFEPGQSPPEEPRFTHVLSTRPACPHRPSSSPEERKDIKSGQLGGEVYLKDAGTDAVDVTAIVGNAPDTLVASMALPAGTFYVRATGYASNTHAALLGELRCFLRSSGDAKATGSPGLYVPIEPDAGTNASRGFYSLDSAFKLKTAGTVRVECSKGAAAQAIQTGASISAVTTPKVHDVP